MQATAMKITHPFGIFSVDMQIALDHHTPKIVKLSYNANLSPREASVDYYFLASQQKIINTPLCELCVSSNAGGESSVSVCG